MLVGALFDTGFSDAQVTELLGNKDAQLGRQRCGGEHMFTLEVVGMKRISMFCPVTQVT